MSSRKYARGRNGLTDIVLASMLFTILIVSSMIVVHDSSPFRDSDEQFLMIMGGPDNVTVQFHLHYDGILDSGDNIDFMNTSGPYNPVVPGYNYDDDVYNGVTLRKNNSPNPPFPPHYFVLDPLVNDPIQISGDGNLSLWGGSRDNDTRIEIKATLFDSNDSVPGGDIVISSGSMFKDPFPDEWQLHYINLTNIDYVLAENHTLILELKREDKNSDMFFIVYDQSVWDSILKLPISRQIDVTEYNAKGTDGIERTEFGENETIYVCANVTDALGDIDIQNAVLNITNISSMTVVSSTNMTLYASDGDTLPSWKLFREQVTGLAAGQYRLNITARDNSDNIAWVEWDIEIIALDHFNVVAPSIIRADEVFVLTIEAIDKNGSRALNWSGTINIDAIDVATNTTVNLFLSNTSANMSLSDDGIILVNESFTNASIDIKIRVWNGNASGESTTITVNPGELTSISLIPPDDPINVNSGQSVSVYAYGKDIFGNVNDTWTPYWNISSSNATISGSGISITLTGILAGNTVLTCTDNATTISVQVNVTITASALAYIVITPEYSTIWEGRSMIVNAQGYDSFSNPVDISSSASWSLEGLPNCELAPSGTSATFSAGMIPENGKINVSANGIWNTTDINVVVPNFGPSFGALPDLIVGSEDTQFPPLDLSKYWSDINGTHDLTWFVTGVNTSLMIIFGDHQTYSIVHIIPQPDQYGTDNVTFGVQDPDGYIGLKEIEIKINPVNDPPEFVNDPPTELYVKYALPYVFDYGYYVSDVDDSHDELFLSTIPVSDYVESDGLEMTFTFPDLYDGEAYFEIITVVLSDGVLSDSLTIKVWATSDTPPDLVLPLPDVTIYEGEMNVEIFDLDDYFFDVDGDVLYYTRGFEYVEIEIVPDTHVVLLSSPSEWSGQTNAVFIAHDPVGAIRTDTILITVLPVNDAPQIKPIPTIHLRYDTPYWLDLRHYVSDADDDINDLDISTSDPINASYKSISYPHLVLLYPANLSGGAYTGPYYVNIQLSVTDRGGFSASRYFQVMVSDNNPPMVSVSPPDLDLIFFEDGFLDKPDSINLYGLFSDPDGDDIVYSFSGIENVTISISTDGWVNFTAEPDWYGTEFVTFTASDPEGAWAALLVRIDVISLNDPPILEQIPDIRHYGGRQWTMSIEMYVSDADHDLSELNVIVKSPGFVKAVGLTLYFDFPENVSSVTVELYIEDPDGGNSEIVLFEVEIRKSIRELIGYPWSLIVVLLLAGIIGYIISRRIPMPHELQDLFIIHNDGRLIYHTGKDPEEGLDRDVVSAMFTAVQEFIKDSFGNEPGSLKTLEVGDRKVLIEKGKWIYAALIYTGWPPKPYLKRFGRFVTDVEMKFSNKIERWDGMVKSLPGIQEMGRAMISDSYAPEDFEIASRRKFKESAMSDDEVIDLLDSDT